MSLLYEQEIKRDLAQKNTALAALEHKLRGWTGTVPVPVAELRSALEEARGAVRDGAVCLENHFSGLIPLEAETLGDILLLLRAADAVVERAIEALAPHG